MGWILFGISIIVIFYLLNKIPTEKPQPEVPVEDFKKIEEFNIQKKHTEIVEALTQQMKDLAAENKVYQYRINNLSDEIVTLNTKNNALHGKQKSEQVRLGGIAENLAPFLEGFKYNPKNLAAMFNPVDFVAFEDDEIVFVEVKSGDAKLSEKQKNIKRIIEEKKVRFEIFRVK